MKVSNILTEAMLLEDPTYRTFKRVGRMIAEQKMSEKEILDMFAQIEAGATAGGSNRTMLGKGKDVVTDIASAINKAYQGVAAKISSSAPVAGFDVAVDKLTDKLAQAAGGQSGAVMTAIKKYREFAKKHPVMQGAIYAGLIALTGLSGAGLGGAAILGGIKAFDKLLLGNKASSALWSGFLTGATAYGVGQAKAAYDAHTAAGGMTPANPSDFGADTANQMEPANPSDFGADTAIDMDAETAARNAAYGKAYGIDGNDTLDQMNQAIMKTAEPGTVPADYSQLGAGNPIGDTAEYVVKKGDTLSQLADKNNVSVEDMMKANPDITNPDVLKAGQTINIPSETGNAVYQGGVGTNADTMSKIASGEYTDSEISQNLAKGAANTGGDAATNAPLELTPRGGTTPAAPSGVSMNPEYLQQVVNGQHPRPMISPEDAQRALDWQAQNGGQLGQAATDVGKEAAKGYSKEYLQSVVNGTHPRPMISVEKAQQLLSYMEGFVVVKPALKEMVDRDLTVRMWALNESLGKNRNRTVQLTSVGVNTVFENTVAYQKYIFGLLREAPADTGPGPGRPEIPDELRPDMPDAKTAPGSGGWFDRATNAVSNAAGSAWKGIKNIGHQFTTKITADKLKMNWHVKGKPTDSDALIDFLQGEGVPPEVIKDVFSKLGLPVDKLGNVNTPPAPPTSDTPAPAADTPAASSTGANPATAAGGPAGIASGSIFAQPDKLWADFNEFMRTGGKVPIQMKGVLKDILLTTYKTVESRNKRLTGIIKEARRIDTEIKKIKKQRL